MRAAQFLLLSAAAAASSAGVADGFAFPSASRRSPSPSLSSSVGRDVSAGRLAPSTTTTRLHGSKEEEIAALEEKLRALKEDPAGEEAPTAETEEAEAEEEEEERSYAVGKPTKKKSGGVDAAAAMMGERRGPNDLDPFAAEMLTEAWKVGDAANGRDKNDAGTAILKIPALGAIAALVALGLFSQVPVGQEDLGKYSTVGTAPSARIDLGDKNPVKSVKDTVYTGE